MKTNEHGIEGSRDVENVYHMRLMTLLQELVREKGYKGAARVLEIDHRTVAVCSKTGQMSRRARQALERALQEGVGSAAVRQRERNDGLEERVQSLEKGQRVVRQGGAQASSAVEGGIAALRRDKAQGTGAGHAGAGPSPRGADESEARASAQHRKPPSRPRVRREYPDLVTLEPAPDDEEIFGEAWPLIVEWREMKDAHPNEGRGLAWLADEERMLVVELALLEDHGMTLPPEKQPLRGFDRDGQTSWRRTALYDTRRARRKRELLRRLTLGLWWR